MAADAPDEDRFAAAMRRLTDLHGTGILLFAAASVAERAFADALRVGDVVRRAVRQGRRDRPDASDSAAIEEAARRIEVAIADAERAPEVAELGRSVAAGEVVRSAELARCVFAGLEPLAQPAAAVGYRSEALRERRRGGETLPAPPDLATRLARRALAPVTGDWSEIAAATGGLPDTRPLDLAMPPPIVLSPSLAGCGSEVALRVPLPSAAAVLRHADSGDLWVLAASLPAPGAVALLAQADDEWWAASPVPWERYSAELTSALREAGVAVTVET
ncbi:MAG TPA: hypothetical protein VFD92_01720 [Candidatus Binatia bacterium]|nr:hypothetical protein [Candidatus Binatia bacterium]